MMCADDEAIDDDIEQTDEWMQYANVSSQFPVYVIEVLIVVDYAIYRRYMQLKYPIISTPRALRSQRSGEE